MNYKRIYNQIIDKGKIREFDDNTYFENHHIIPTSIGGSDTTDNIVKLTAREHFICHWLLWKFSTGSDKYRMGHAFFYMCFHDSEERKVNSWAYKYAREAHAQSASFFHKGKTLTDSQKIKRAENPPNRKFCIIDGMEFPSITEAAKFYNVDRSKIRMYLNDDCDLSWLKGESYFKNKQTNSLRKAKISNSLYGHNNHTNESKLKISESNRKRNLSDETKRKIGSHQIQDTFLIKNGHVVIVRGRKNWCIQNGYSKHTLNNFANKQKPLPYGNYSGYFVYSQEEYENIKNRKHN